MLTISENGRFLVHRDTGKPFFYLGDTAWELFHRLTREEIAHYLETRAAQGFTVIQAVCLAEFDGLNEPNREGHLPLHDLDPARPNEAYFELVDWAVDYAANLGLMMGLLPTWGDKVNQSWGKGPVIFTPENAFAYGQFLGRRYQNAPLIWINGGDRKVENDYQAETWKQLARGLKDGDHNAHLMTFHPQGGQSSAATFHNEPWLDFNMIQSGHGFIKQTNDVMIAADYAQTPTKPCMDSEPCYENHPINFNAANGRFTTRQVRAAAYRALFAGAHGHTYGCHDMWQFFDPARHTPVNSANTSWRDALQFPAAKQMQIVKNLLLSRPFLSRIPAPELLVQSANETGDNERRAHATKDESGSYALVYAPFGEPFTVRLNELASGGKVRAWWLDPRTGVCDEGEARPASQAQTFTPPTSGDDNDWVLVLDAVSANFSRPGVVETV